MATIYDIALRAGVSAATVSRALNNDRVVKRETKEKIVKIAQELNYIPNSAARTLKHGKTFTIAVILPDIVNEFFSLVARGVEDYAHAQGYSVIICNSDESWQKEQEYIKVVSEKSVDGIVFISTSAKSNRLQKMAENGLNFVLVDRYLEANVDMVLTNNINGAFDAMQHLIRLGHQRIAVINGPQTTQTARERFLGYKKALEEASLELDSALIREGDYRINSGYREMHHLLRLPSLPTAVFVANDLMAVGALDAAEECGVRIPEDLAVVGYDDIPLASRIRPRLTTVAQPKYELGSKAAELLINRLEEDESLKLPQKRIVLEPRLVIRDSSAVMRKLA